MREQFSTLNRQCHATEGRKNNQNGFYCEIYWIHLSSGLEKMCSTIHTHKVRRQQYGEVKAAAILRSIPMLKNSVRYYIFSIECDDEGKMNKNKLRSHATLTIDINTEWVSVQCSCAYIFTYGAWCIDETPAVFPFRVYETKMKLFSTFFSQQLTFGCHRVNAVVLRLGYGDQNFE